jgi:hypothetical protein
MALMDSNDSKIEEEILSAILKLTSLTQEGRIQWQAPLGAISEELRVSTPRTTFAISPVMLGVGLDVQLYDSQGVKVVDMRVQKGTPLGNAVHSLYALAHKGVFKPDVVIHDLLEDLEEE